MVLQAAPPHLWAPRGRSLDCGKHKQIATAWLLHGNKGVQGGLQRSGECTGRILRLCGVPPPPARVRSAPLGDTHSPLHFLMPPEPVSAGLPGGRGPSSACRRPARQAAAAIPSTIARRGSYTRVDNDAEPLDLRDARPNPGPHGRSYLPPGGKPGVLKGLLTFGAPLPAFPSRLCGLLSELPRSRLQSRQIPDRAWADGGGAGALCGPRLTNSNTSDMLGCVSFA